MAFIILMIILAPEELSTTSSPKRELTQHDIGTLKQQLQEIKEQVRIFTTILHIIIVCNNYNTSSLVNIDE